MADHGKSRQRLSLFVTIVLTGILWGVGTDFSFKLVDVLLLVLAAFGVYVALRYASRWFAERVSAGAGQRETDPGFLDTGTPWPVIDPKTLPVPDSFKRMIRYKDRALSVTYLDGDRLALLPEPLQHAYWVIVEARDRSTDLEKRLRINLCISFMNGLKINEVKECLRRDVMPHLSERERKKLTEGASSGWTTFRELYDTNWIADFHNIIMGSLLLGQMKGERDDFPYHVQMAAEGHLMMIAPPGAGKNQCYILPNLARYSGPVICLDPKGENYDNTAWCRHKNGDVYRFAPWSDDTDCFNPLDFVESWDDARALTSLLVVPEKYGISFWDKAATDLITGLIWYLRKGEAPAKQNLREVVRMLSTDDYHALIENLAGVEDENLQDAVSNIMRHASSASGGGSGGPLDSIFLTARTQLEIWASPDVAAATSSTTPGFDPVRMLRRCRDREDAADSDPSLNVHAHASERGDDGYLTFERGVVDSVFVIIPPDKIREYAAVLRVLLGWTLKKVIGYAGTHVGDYSIDRRPFLFIFDELPQLGYMEVIEQAVPIARGYGIRLWMVAQSLAQLQTVYPQWQTLMSGCVAEVFFSPGDTGTAEYLSRRLGTRDDIWGGRTDVAPVRELMSEAYKGKAIAFFREQKPALLDLPQPFYKKKDADEHWEDQRKEWTEKLDAARGERRQSTNQTEGANE